MGNMQTYTGNLFFSVAVLSSWWTVWPQKQAVSYENLFDLALGRTVVVCSIMYLTDLIQPSHVFVSAALLM